ncbi:MAG: HlyD family secretion protein [Pseudomonadota bacterium]
MIEFTICSLLTILPDFLIRRFVQGKRVGVEITLYSMWYELRYGITACAILTISLITMIFYFHPSSGSVTSIFRTVTILPETAGRVDEVFVQNNQKVKAGDPIFKMDDARQRTALVTAERQVDVIEAQFGVAEADLEAAVAQIAQVEASLNELRIELNRTETLMARGSSAVSQQDLDRQQAEVLSQEAALAAATSQADGARQNLETLLPAQRASAIAARDQAQVELDLTEVFAGTDGTVEQFVLQPGDYVSAILRPAGIIVPDVSVHYRLQAGYDQISAQVIKPGMLAEVTCTSIPFTVIPMVVVSVQDVIASGQLRPTDELIDIAARARPGTITVGMEPLYEGGIDKVIPGSQCVSNVYTSNHERLQDPELSGLQRFGLHVIDTTGLVHAFILRIHALLLPVRTLVLSGGH